ncbi:aminoglycoside phosphotransferase family protein [Gayadomonas joobiniege]|uniref:aminoglycoside phosphotransferase family protein n=1 Tax=Gayadomonas joobiniege TaxID=1234606 RepID=UPI000367C89B|nr:phosphotransferase [Gayadomonas joobiniege]
MSQKKNRIQAMTDWLKLSLDRPFSITPLSTDAGFRRYFLIDFNDQTKQVAVDAPPETEDNALFVRLSQWFTQQGIRVSQVLSADLEQGFMRQEFLPQIHLADRLNAHNYAECYQECFQQLAQIQQLDANQQGLPSYSNAMIATEFKIFMDWYLPEVSNYTLSKKDLEILSNLNERLQTVFAEQKQVLVHRDYHCRNLMYDLNDKLTLIDYQGAVQGPLTYDLVSLLKDCYQQWPPAQVCMLSQAYRASYYPDIDDTQWQYWFDLTGLQRHLKCLGIFVRLAKRDGKTSYLKHLPLVKTYILEVTAKYSELAQQHTLFTQMFGTKYE